MPSLILDNVVVSAGTKNIATSTKPSDMSSDRRIKVSHWSKLTVGASRIPKVGRANQVSSEWIVSEQDIITTSLQSRLTIASFIVVESYIIEVSLRI